VLAHVRTFAIEGVDGVPVTVEVDVRSGLPAFTIVGLPDRAVREARERVRAAILNCGFEFPLRRLTVNLAPASLEKGGPSFDLAIAVGLLAASGQVPATACQTAALWGELSLDGRLRDVPGTLIAALAAERSATEILIVPEHSADEALAVDGPAVVAVRSLRDIAELLRAGGLARAARRGAPSMGAPDPLARDAHAHFLSDARVPDLADVRGQDDAKWALEVAAAGGHNLLMVGPPGVGKTMLARRLPGLLPPPSREEAIDIARVRAAAGLPCCEWPPQRPFRAPHHSISAQGLVGGGSPPRPGEITLAHRGVLFLDECTELARSALEALRQPLEDGVVQIVRGQRTIAFPARPLLVAACNPCACGGAACDCSASEQRRYARKLSGPILDRIDIVCELCATRDLDADASRGSLSAHRDTASVRARVNAARRIQRERYDGAASVNGDPSIPLARVLGGKERMRRLLARVAAAGLSGRAAERVLRVARTLADLEECREVEAAHVEQARGLRLGLHALGRAA